MIVEAIREDLFSGPKERIYTKRSGFQCPLCSVSYELVIHAEEGEYEALADPLPPHLDLIADVVEADHGKDHAILGFLTDGVRHWSPLKSRSSV